MEVIIEKERKETPAFVSLLVYTLSFFLLRIILSRVVYALFIPAGVTSVASLTITQLFLMQATTFLSAAITTLWVLRLLDCRPFSDLGFSIKGRGKDILYGALAAVALYGIGFGLSVACGVVEVASIQLNVEWLTGSFFFFLLVSVTEELMFRGYILRRLLHTRMNKFLALLLSSSLFACMHLANPNIALLPMLNLLLAGVLLGLTYLYTRNLWFPISLHLFWNWLQGPILGYEVSGNKLGDSLLKLHLSDDTLLSGGVFGFEGSLLCTALMIVLTLVIYYNNK